jgi:hypothetical protein
MRERPARASGCAQSPLIIARRSVERVTEESCATEERMSSPPITAPADGTSRPTWGALAVFRSMLERRRQADGSKGRRPRTRAPSPKVQSPAPHNGTVNTRSTAQGGSQRT